MDRRQKKTRMAIFDAFTELLEVKNFASITVQEIIDRADVGRSTFYSHFETKDELLKSLSSEIFEHVFSENLKKERTHDFSVDHDFRAEITHILYHLRDSRNYIRGILNSESSELFNRYFKEYLYQVFEGQWRDQEYLVPKEYLLNHQVSAFAETVRWWMNHEAYTSEEIAGFFFAVIPK